MVRTNEDGKDEYADDCDGRVFDCGVSPFTPAPSATGVEAFDSDFPSPFAPNFPFLLNHSIISGSLPLSPAHPISIPFNPLSSLPLAQTAANASPILLNGTTAVAYFAGLSGCFFGGLRERNVSASSVVPNGERRDLRKAGVVNVG
jgi:hypothetical protein